MEQAGIILRALNDIFGHVSNVDGLERTFKISFYEIYQEQIRDLLDTSVPERDISIRDFNGSIHVKGISERN